MKSKTVLTLKYTIQIHTILLIMPASSPYPPSIVCVLPDPVYP